MAFFDSELANSVQYFTFPLEALGFSLAMIEVRYPGVARRMAIRIASLAEWNRQVSEIYNSKDAEVIAQMKSFNPLTAIRLLVKPSSSLEYGTYVAGTVAVIATLLAIWISDADPNTYLDIQIILFTIGVVTCLLWGLVAIVWMSR
jgi:hypothetical protein